LDDEVSQPCAVTVTVPARLHLGFLDLNGGLGRRFGGIGLAIGGLGTRLTIERASTSEASGPDADRVSQHLQKIERLLSLLGGHRIRVSEVVPAHAGLGSGTQLALAVAAGLRSLHNLPLDIAGDALRLGRGARSGIGIGLQFSDLAIWRFRDLVDFKVAKSHNHEITKSFKTLFPG